MKGLLFISFCFVFGMLGSTQTISEIKFENVKRSNPQFLESRLDLIVGNVCDEEAVIRNVQYLTNLNLFLAVDYRIDSTENNTVNVCFIITEAVYIYPILLIGGFDNKLNLSVGVGDINFRGKAQSIGFIYQYYDRHSFSFYQAAAVHKNGKTGHDFSLGKKSTVEPLYFDTIKGIFNFDNYHVSIGGHYWFNRYLKLGVGGMLMYENYQNKGVEFETPDHVFDLEEKFNFLKYQLRTAFEYSNVNYSFERRQGIKNTVFVETIQTDGVPMASFLKVTNEFNAYKHLGKSGMVSFRNRLGIATNNDSPFSPFVIDGFVNIRGSGDRVARGTGEIIFNAEYLHTVWRNKWFYLMMNAFTDVGYLRPPGGSIASSFENQNAYYFSGIGLRIHSRKLYNTVIRLDYGFDLENLSNNGLTFGFGHFF